MLLVLVVVWGVVIFSWLRSRVRATFGDPVGTFRRHLTVLENAGPTTVRPANRMRLGAAPLSPPSLMAPRRGPGPRAGELDHLRQAARPPVRPGPRSAAAAQSAASFRRRQALKRRRDVLLALVTGAVGSLLLGLIPGLHAMLLVNLIIDMLLAAYVSLLIRLRNLAAERDRKLAYLPRTAPANLTRAANARSATRATPGRASQVAGGRRRASGGFERLSGYDPGRYGEVAMRRVAVN